MRCLELIYSILPVKTNLSEDSGLDRKSSSDFLNPCFLELFVVNYCVFRMKGKLEVKIG
jgi:hypothetical protein